VHGDVATGAEDHPHVVAYLEGIERRLVAGARGSPLLCVDVARGAHQGQRDRPSQRVFRTKTRSEHGRRSVHHFYFGGIFAALSASANASAQRLWGMLVKRLALLSALVALSTIPALAQTDVITGMWRPLA